MREIPIETVYENDNKGSHFHPFRDSIRIYAKILKYSAASLLSFVLDFCLLFLFKRLFGEDGKGLGEFGALTLATVLARVISATFNFTLNRLIVFRHHGNLWKALGEYALLALTVLGAKVVFINLLDRVLPLFWANLICEVVLYCLNYQVQKLLIFKKESKQ